jgi:hypothetical protein
MVVFRLERVAFGIFFNSRYRYSLFFSVSNSGGTAMHLSGNFNKLCASFLASALVLSLAVPPSFAQAHPPFSPEQLDRIVSRIALYPDPLLAQILTASTFPDQIPEAAGWADEHHYLTGAELAKAIEDDHLPWDPSVQALLPFPSVLDMMASDMTWTNDLGNAVLTQRSDVMDAIQRMRRKAKEYGYLRSNQQIIVSDGPYISIEPAEPDFIVVPYYDPLIVFAPPPPGFFVGGAIVFGFGVTLGAWFRPWGWGACHIRWKEREIFINNVRWERTWVNRDRWDRSWVNRGVYVRGYPGLHRYVAANRVEPHVLIRRSAEERVAARTGLPLHEMHRRR